MRGSINNVFADFLSEFQLRRYVVGKRCPAISQKLKAKKFHVVWRLIRYFFTILYNFVQLGFAIAENNDWSKLKKNNNNNKA